MYDVVILGNIMQKWVIVVIILPWCGMAAMSDRSGVSRRGRRGPDLDKLPIWTNIEEQTVSDMCPLVCVCTRVHVCLYIYPCYLNWNQCCIQYLSSCCICEVFFGLAVMLDLCWRVVVFISQSRADKAESQTTPKTPIYSATHHRSTGACGMGAGDTIWTVLLKGPQSSHNLASGAEQTAVSQVKPLVTGRGSTLLFLPSHYLLIYILCTYCSFSFFKAAVSSRRTWSILPFKS